MPNNSDKGMLEHFLSQLVPNDREELWQTAQDTVDNLPTKPFVHTIADHMMKAKVHTYLAWQEESGKPYGVAVSEKYFEAHSPQAQKFIAWIRSLFDLEEKSESNIPQN
jgi:hypothetical protein